MKLWGNGCFLKVLYQRDTSLQSEVSPLNYSWSNWHYEELTCLLDLVIDSNCLIFSIDQILHSKIKNCHWIDVNSHTAHETEHKAIELNPVLDIITWYTQTKSMFGCWKHWLACSCENDCKWETIIFQQHTSYFDYHTYYIISTYSVYIPHELLFIS